MIRVWHIDYKGFQGVHTSSYVEGRDIATPEQAIEAYLKSKMNHDGDKYRASMKAKEGRPKVETFDELRDWMVRNQVTPTEAQSGIQIMCINSRPENVKPFLCPNKKCRKDMNKVGVDNVGQVYSCHACGEPFQWG